MVCVWGLFVCVNPAGGQTDRQTATHPAGVALEELDLLVELDVVGSQVVQLALQSLHRVLHHAVLLHGGTGAMSSEDGDRMGSNHGGGRRWDSWGSVPSQ